MLEIQFISENKIVAFKTKWRKVIITGAIITATVFIWLATHHTAPAASDIPTTTTEQGK